MLSQAIIRYVLRNTLNLQLLPKNIAAVSLILAINIALSPPIKKHIDLNIELLSGFERVRCGGTFFLIDQWQAEVDTTDSAFDPENPI